MNHKLIKNFIIYGLGFGLSKFSMLLVLPLVTSVLPPEEFGKIELVQTVYNFLMIFGVFQLDASLQRFYSSDEFDKNKLISATISFVLITNFFLLLVVNWLGWFFLDWLALDMSVVYLCSILIFLSNVSSILFIVYRYDDRPITLSLFTFMQVLTQVTLIYYFLILNGKGITYYFLSQVIGFTVLIIFQILFLNRKLFWSLDWSYLSRLFAFGLPQMPARIGSVVNRHISKIFILSSLSVYSLGIYSAALKVSSLAQVLYLGFNMSWYPIFYKMINDKDYSKLSLMNVSILIFCIYTSVVFCLVSPWIGDLLLSDEYKKSYIYMAPLFLSTMIFMVKSSVEVGMVVKEKMKYISYVYYFSFSISVILYGFFSRQGILAIVTIQFLSNFLLIIATLYFSEKLFYIGFSYSANIIGLIGCFFYIVAMSFYELSNLDRMGLIVLFTGIAAILFYLLLKRIKQRVE